MANNNGLNKINEALKKAAEEKEKSLGKVAEPIITPPPSAAAIPAYEAPIPERIMSAGVDHKIVAYFNPKDPIVEQFRSLRTHIYSSEATGSLKTIIITSSQSREGKTLVAINLSIVMAQDLEKPILLIDCNLRKPCVDIYLGLKSDRGLSDVLSGNTQLSDVLINTDVKNLTVLPAGQIPMTPTELLGSQKMKDLLAELKAKFDYIVLDAPPVIPYADPRILGPLADGAVMVVRTGVTRREAIARAESILKSVNCNILGYVLTGIEYHIPEYIHRHL
ncbi:MAG: CpsD/CapB family tyrosine-protein kinase [Candidatus Omnitrophota bacterium]|nr:CpsD/CapB family tyrosine-protein kinase [Candidatus Omnitrophota bacterium]